MARRRATGLAESYEGARWGSSDGSARSIPQESLRPRPELDCEGVGLKLLRVVYLVNPNSFLKRMVQTIRKENR